MHLCSLQHWVQVANTLAQASLPVAMAPVSSRCAHPNLLRLCGGLGASTRSQRHLASRDTLVQPQAPPESQFTEVQAEYSSASSRQRSRSVVAVVGL